MTTNDLFDFMKEAREEMCREYERIRKRALEDPGTVGDEGEENWAELFRNWVPEGFHVVTQGRLLFACGKTSPQVDVIILHR